MTANVRNYDLVKRILDIISATLLILITGPIQMAVAAVIAVKLGRPIFFRQPRPGHHGEVFTMLKFRSMKDIDARRGLLSDEDRLTPFGRKLRSTSLDELPTLWNVLRGDMSMIGPRPLLVEYLERYSPQQARRHEVRPGITGLAQVSGRNSLNWDQKFELDLKYVDNRSFSYDAKVLLRTGAVVLSRQGISGTDHVTMRKFGDDHGP